MGKIVYSGFWLLLPYVFALAAYINGRKSAAVARSMDDLSLPLADRQAAEMRRYSSKQDAVAFGILALLTSAILMVVENALKSMTRPD